MRTTHTTNDTSRAGEARLGIPLRAALAALLLVSVSACRGESNSEDFRGAEADAGQTGDYQADAGQGDQAPAPQGADSAAADDQRMDDAEVANDPLFDAERLEQMVAPVALYPDSLLTQVLMASTYPLEVVEADRWVKDNSDLRGEALDKALVDKNWDESVKSMTRFPDVLAQLSNNLDWTRDLGDAFLAQRGDVLNAVQTMRLGACDAGKLKTTAEQKVIIEPAPAPTEPYVGVVPQPQRIVQIVPADPMVIQVPQYSPAVVFGPPPTLYYPVYNAYPPSYVPSTSIISFGLGLAVGAILWSDTDWHHHRVYTRGRGGYRDDYRDGYGGYNRWSSDRYSSQGYSPWRHDSSHRRGETYRSPVVRSRYLSNGYDPRDNRDYGKSKSDGPHDNRNHEKLNGRDNRDYGKSDGRDSRDNRDSGRPDGHDARDNREFNRPEGHDSRENRDLQRPDARGLDAGPGRLDKDRSDPRPPPPGPRGPQGGPGDKAHGPQGGRDDHGAKNAPSMEKPRGGSPQARPSMEKPRGGSPQSKPSMEKPRGGSPSSGRSGSGQGNASRPPSPKQGGSSGDRGGNSKSDKGGGGDKKKDDSGKDAKQGGGHGR